MIFSLLESDVQNIEEVFAAAKSGDLEASRQVSFSLLQKKTSKVRFNGDFDYFVIFDNSS